MALQYARELQAHIDQLTKEVYGSGATFKMLSAFGQTKIEAMARDRMDPAPRFGRSVLGRAADKIEEERNDLERRLGSALRQIEALEDENEFLRQELDEYEGSNNRTAGKRETGYRELVERALRADEPEAPSYDREGN